MTKVNHIFLFIIGISFILALLFGGNIPYIIFYALFLIFSISFIYIHLQKYFINVEVVFRESVYQAGDSADCLTIIKCNSILPVPYILVESDVFSAGKSGHCGEVVTVTLEENAWINTNVKFYSRGIYNFGKVRLKLKDLFCIFEFTKVYDRNLKVKVYPRIYDIEGINAGGKDIFQEAFNYKSASEDMFTIKDVRRYRTGDSLKRIHWKVSAKLGELYVRESENISGEEYAIFLNMGKINYTLDKYGVIEERMVDLCASVVRFMQLKGIKSKIYLNTLHPLDFEISTAENMNSFLDFLIEQKSDGDMEFDKFIYNNIHKLQKVNGIAIITGAIDEGYINEFVDIRNSGYPIAVFFCGEKDAIGMHSNILNSAGVSFINYKNIIIDAQGDML